MKIAYYLIEGRKKNLYCRISDGAERVTFNLEHTIDPRQWDAKKEEADFDNYFTLMNFKEYLGKRYYELKSEEKTDILTILKTEANTFLDGSGIEGIARKMFDFSNEKDGLPKYDEFIQAFEKFSNLKKGKYQTRTVGTVIHFHTDEEIYEMDTYAGKTALLKSFIEERLYSEIYTETNENIWNEIYVDAGIEKHVFIPQMLHEWESYWNETYKDIKERVGKTNHLDEMKEESWRQFQVYMECFNDQGDSIKFAYAIDEDILYPIAVITMMKIFDADTCYDEYCEHEFNNGEWESISLGDDDNLESPIFYIKPYEM